MYFRTHDKMNRVRKNPLRICSFESRKVYEMRSLIERHDGIATIAPSMQEVPLDKNVEALGFAEALFQGRIGVVIFMTGVGARALLEAIESQYDRATFFDALKDCCVIVRGPKPTAILRQWCVRIDHHAPEPNTWRELLAMIDAEQVSVAGKAVAVQEYGQPNHEFYHELERRKARVKRVPVYRWSLPDDTGPLVNAIQTTIDGQFDVLMFTSANQLTNVLQIAEMHNSRSTWLKSAGKCIIASIGPTTSEALRLVGLPVDLQPEHPKMGHLVREVMQAAPEILQKKYLEE